MGVNGPGSDGSERRRLIGCVSVSNFFWFNIALVNVPESYHHHLSDYC